MESLERIADGFFTLLDDKSGAANASDMFCFRRALNAFLKSGKKTDAFTVYFCFSEIFKLFGLGYENMKKLLETLSDHEYHSGELLVKHRDHYSHSVYVFALGLAVYARDGVFRRTFNEFYGHPQDAFGFLRLWGTASLFHDIGYPFQLAHEQIKSYLDELWINDAARDNGLDYKALRQAFPFVSYGNMDTFLHIDDATAARIKKSLCAPIDFTSVNEIFAYGLNKREGYDYDYIVKLLKTRVEVQFDFMDHAYFGAVILAKRMFENKDFRLDSEWLDVLTAVLLHNSLNKYDIKGAHRIALVEHPLSYLLILCDELQAWDRHPYGKESKRAPIAWDIKLDISDNRISAEFYFDQKNSNYSDVESGKLVGDIHKFVDSPAAIEAVAVEKKKQKKFDGASDSDDSFINLCDFAKAIHASYIERAGAADEERINSDFAELPLEFKVSNIEQAKSYAHKLELVDCFYSGKELDYPIVNDFRADCRCGRGEDPIELLSREEHVRWVREKLEQGWSYGTDYASIAERNAKKIHSDIVPYEVLSEADRKKDELAVTNIIPLLNKFGNGVKIYNRRSGRLPDLVVGGTGHRYFNGDVTAIKQKIKSILVGYAKDYRVIVRTCYAAGADLLIAECACELGLTTKAAIPMPYEQHIASIADDAENSGKPLPIADILRARHLLAQTAVCKVIPDPEFTYYEASRYVVDNCDKLIAVWDGKELPLFDSDGKPINRGGTYHCITIAKARGLKERTDIHIIECTR